MEIYQHFRGGLYTKLYEARHTETDEMMIIYSCNASGDVFCRPLSMWAEEVEENHYRGPRFIRVPYISSRDTRKKLKLIYDMR